MPTLRAAFAITSWDYTAYDEPAAGPPAGLAVIGKAYSGPLEGTAEARMLTVQGDDGRAYLAQERIVGTLDGRAGSFVLQHGAQDAPGAEPQQWAFVVPGSGTGQLAGLRGTGVVQHERLTLDYDLPEQ